ncbi:hypothetical protein PDTA9759_56210 (plasmid) [Phytobacter diazotrophicus]|uniref:Uncharacterized protein n=1 Tax=Phytobacter diazotrophicus TaxID=395631 RepID=A0ABN6LXC7_9ENTR|nr:hypothetical protein SE15cs_04971 [Salmonella enterica subsp. enterica serovar Typhimurium]SSG38598.1 Uncharacterised protein [Klebsiella pneumoniae]SUG75152.1 Uncharacterised protein [Salmonella enterica]BDD53927.1 hypothetical protein PDTA9734_54140 [Phytobacter diazotrophicus]STX88548.1 Uncharacterised protein [Klebsiella pneumoniae]
MNFHQTGTFDFIFCCWCTVSECPFVRCQATNLETYNSNCIKTKHYFINDILFS